VNIKLAMNSREKLSELPLNRFYRYVLEPEVTFDGDGSMAEGPLALFSDMPQSVLFTMNMDTPLGWMVEAVYSPHDLDNIKLQEVRMVIYINNSFHLARKYSRMFVRKHYLFREANSFPRAKREENCEL